MSNNVKDLSLSDKEIQYIVNLLAERPYKETAPLISKIVQQVNSYPEPAAAEG